MMPAWLTLRVAMYLGAAIAALAALWWLYSAITANPRAEARLARNQAEAASQSGADAANTVAAAGAREADSGELTRTNEQEIRNAPGANTPVSAEASAAGMAALCRRAAYRNDPRCVRH